MASWVDGIGNQIGDEIDQETGTAAVPGVLNLRDVVELVINGLNDGAFAQEQLDLKGHEAVLHVVAQTRNELHTFREKLVE